MHPASRRFSFAFLTVLFVFQGLVAIGEPVPLKRVVELALSHSTSAASAEAMAQRAYASYREARNQYLPTLVVGSGLGYTQGYPLSLEGSAPSIVNTTAQSALINPALRDFVREARTQWQATTVRSKEERDQLVQDTVLSYAELSKWESLLAHLTEDYSAALKMEQLVNERIQAGVDSPQARTQARLNTARVYLHIAQAQGSIDVLRGRLSQLTGLPRASIETMPDSIPALPEIKQDENLAARALEVSPAVQIASLNSTALRFHARAEHRTMLPTMDFAAQYALLAKFNNYQNFFKNGSFQRNNASIGAVIRFPFFSPTQRAAARAADFDALRARHDQETAKNQVSEQTLKLQRSVEQLAASQDVADLEYQVAKSNLDAVQIRVDSGTATLHDEDDARNQASERYDTLQDTRFELERARIALLRATGDLNSWLGLSK
ncbi:MAG: TolC family protein [Acidobacteriaceae bacterium]|nr:TolC family protein [Acidobacteriaceae bacterium]